MLKFYSAHIDSLYLRCNVVFWHLVAGCRTNSDCSGSHACVQRNCVPVCSPSLASCGKNAICHGIHHKAICECPPGFGGNPSVSCVLLGCRSNSDCPTNKACINNRCENPCAIHPCTDNMECNVYNHVVECACPPGYIGDVRTGCTKGKSSFLHYRLVMNYLKTIFLLLLKNVSLSLCYKK